MNKVEISMNNVFKHKRQNKSRSSLTSLSYLPRNLYTKFVEIVFLCFCIDLQDYECLGVASIQEFCNIVFCYVSELHSQESVYHVC